MSLPDEIAHFDLGRYLLRGVGGGLRAAALVFLSITTQGQIARTQSLVRPEMDLAQLVANSPPGASFTLLPGKHYAGDLVPKDRQIFRGEPGAILSGAIRLGPFRRDGRYWSASGPSSLAVSHGSCDRKLGVSPERCVLREDLFVDEVPLRRVQSIEQLGQGTWYQFRATGAVLVPFDPTGRLVELSYRPTAFKGSAQDVTISHLVIEQYASIAQHGAIEGFGTRWIVSNNMIRFNSGTGIRTGESMWIRGNAVIANGQLGIGGGGNDLVVEDNIITKNNTHGYSPSWEAGGTKFWATNDLVFARNCVQGNLGHGIWTDTDNRNSVIVGNWSINNSGAGIFHEISGRSLIADNISALNGSRENSPWASQLLISGSLDTLAWNNTIMVAPRYGQGAFIVQENRPNTSKIIGTLPYYDAKNNVIANNEMIFLGDAGTSGFYSSHGGSSTMLGKNHFHDNRIVIKSGSARRFVVGSAAYDLSELQAQNQGLGSQLVNQSSIELQGESGLSCPSVASGAAAQPN